MLISDWLTQNKSNLTHSSGSPLHFVMITDKNSLNNLVKNLSNIIKQFISEGVITTNWRRQKGLPKMKFSLVDCEEIVKTHRDFFQAMRNNSQQQTLKEASYSQDLFYIAPIYHKIFSSLDKIIFLDSKDLEFRIDVAELEDEFNKMNEREVIGIAADNSPHYRQSLQTYISKHPHTDLGLPGQHQGYNSGVVLYR